MKNYKKILSNVFIVFASASLILLSIPYLLAYIPYTKPVMNNSEYAIVIPKIHAASPIILGVDAWNQKKYNVALSHGIAQAKGTFLPGDNKLIYLFAHSSGNPWEVLGRNIPFLRLGELKSGDTILLYKKHKGYAYTVQTTIVVSANDTKFLTNTNRNILILQTCWPIGTDWRRLLVFAEPS